MKHYIVNILVAAALTLCSLTSCVKEKISAPDHEEGTVYLSLNVLSGGMDQVIVKSPWDPNDDNERAVENLRIYIFSKATGNLVGYKYFSKSDLTLRMTVPSQVTTAQPLSAISLHPPARYISTPLPMQGLRSTRSLTMPSSISMSQIFRILPARPSCRRPVPVSSAP